MRLTELVVNAHGILLGGYMRAARLVKFAALTGLTLMAGLQFQVTMADGLNQVDLATSRSDLVHLAMLDVARIDRSPSALTGAIQASRSGMSSLSPDSRVSTAFGASAGRYFEAASTAGVAVQSSEPMSIGDLFLAMLVGAGLIAYQLCRKHRMLRPHPFGA